MAGESEEVQFAGEKQPYKGELPDVWTPEFQEESGMTFSEFMDASAAAEEAGLPGATGPTSGEAAQYLWQQSQKVSGDMKDIEAGVQENYLGPALGSAEYGGSAAGFAGSGRVQVSKDKAYRAAMEQEGKLKFQREKETAMVANMWIDSMHKQQLLSWEEARTEAEFLTQFWEMLKANDIDYPQQKMIAYQEAQKKCALTGKTWIECQAQSVETAFRHNVSEAKEKEVETAVWAQQQGPGGPGVIPNQ
jgi:hypothetical protein